jgi:hypothetical protein
MRRHTTLVLLVVAGCAVVATAACSSPSSPAAPPVAAPATLPSASAGVGGPDAQAPSPAASPSATSKKPPTGQGGKAGEVDWKRVAFRTLGCKQHADLPDRAEVQRVDHADLTGDGKRDAIVTASCPTTTSTNAVHVFVFGGDSTGKPLLDAGQGEYLRTADVTVSGRTIKVDAEALSKQAPLCCPDLRISQSWRWNGSTFEPEAKNTEKI